MIHYTLQDLVEFTKREKKMVESVLPEAQEEYELTPSEESIRHILGYSKALNIRVSKKINRLRIILN